MLKCTLTLINPLLRRARRWSKESNHSGVSISHLSPYCGRQISTGSSSSAGSIDSEVFVLPSDRQANCNPDGIVAQQSLELLITCLSLRSSRLGGFEMLPKSVIFSIFYKII